MIQRISRDRSLSRLFCAASMWQGLGFQNFRAVYLWYAIAVAIAIPNVTQAAAIPTHFTGAGLGFQNSATPRTSGFMVTCVTTMPTLYACLATDYTGGTTSTRAEAHQLIRQFGRCGIFGTGGAGAATGASGGVGGSFDAGGVIGCEIPLKLIRQRGIYATFSGSWQKNNIVQAPDVGTALRAFGQQTVWRFGFGKGW